jgi:hypothetical protein
MPSESVSSKLLTNQEDFDRVWDHFITKKNPKSMTFNGETCAYRGVKNSRCAAGLFISDEKYDPKFEGQSISFVTHQKKSDDGELIFDENVNHIHRKLALVLMDVVEDIFFLQRLQNIHDTIWSDDFIDVMKNKLIGLAAEYNLTYPNE